MGKYIDKAAVVAEIESLRRATFTNFDEGVNATVQTLLETLDTLEVKEVDLDEEIEKCLKRHSMLALGKKDFTDIAKQFFELGMAVGNKAQKTERRIVMKWKCNNYMNCEICKHYHVDKSINKPYCLKTGKEIK